MKSKIQKVTNKSLIIDMYRSCKEELTTKITDHWTKIWEKIITDMSEEILKSNLRIGLLDFSWSAPLSQVFLVYKNVRLKSRAARTLWLYHTLLEGTPNLGDKNKRRRLLSETVPHNHASELHTLSPIFGTRKGTNARGIPCR